MNTAASSGRLEITGQKDSDPNSERRYEASTEHLILRNHREVVPTFVGRAGASVICVNRLLDSEQGLQ